MADRRDIKAAPYCAPYHPDPGTPGHKLPAGACDTHAHICGPERVYPYDSERIYTPPDALLPAYEHMLKTIGAERMVLVQPSIYGKDNRVMLKAMHEASLPARGVAVVSTDIEREELADLNRAGIRGLRFNLVDVKNPAMRPPLDEIAAMAERIKPLGWHIEFLIHVDDYPDFEDMFRDFPTEVVVGHMGYLRPGCPVDHPGFQGLVNLAESGSCWVKLTGPYRIAGQDFPYADIVPFVSALVERASHRLLWGTDWPHVMMEKTMPDDGDLADLLAQWVPDHEQRYRILVDNPERLYQF